MSAAPQSNVQATRALSWKKFKGYKFPLKCSSASIPVASTSNPSTQVPVVVVNNESSSSSTPLLDAITKQASNGDAPFHFPGHKRGSGAPVRLIEAYGASVFAHDLPELPELDNLFSPEGVILEAQEQAAKIFGAEKTFFLVNGSTVGVHAAIMATCHPKHTLILPRNSHQSAFSAMVLSGAVPKYVLPEYSETWDISLGVTPETIRAAIVQVIEDKVEENANRNPIGAVFIVSPTYNGICSDIKGIAKVCEEFQIPLIVDEAHGAHFTFSDSLPPCALHQGADVAVQSAHKVLGSLTQSAMLHLQGTRISESRIATCLQLLQSSSPSYLLLGSLDAATWQMASPDGKTALESAIELATWARRELSLIEGVSVLGEDDLGCPSIVPNGGLPGGKLGVAGWDPLRVTVSLRERFGLTGFEVDDLLRLEFGVVAELPSLHSLTFALSAGTAMADVDRLLSSLRSISSTCLATTAPKAPQRLLSRPSFTTVCPKMNLTPRDAFYAGSSSSVPCCDAIGHVSAELLCPYPPGVPVLVPGEVISEEAVSYLREVIGKGGFVSGASDSTLETLAVISGAGE